MNAFFSYVEFLLKCFREGLIQFSKFPKIFRSSPPLAKVFSGKCFLKICTKFTGGHLCRRVISIKFQSNFTEITLRYGCYPLSLLHIFRTPLPENTYGGLLLNIWLQTFCLFIVLKDQVL